MLEPTNYETDYRLPLMPVHFPENVIQYYSKFNLNIIKSLRYIFVNIN